MPNLHECEDPERSFEYQAVLIGRDRRTGAVRRVWLDMHGRLTDGILEHRPTGGITAEQATAVQFGLTDPRCFPVSDLLAAARHAAQLRA